MKLETYIENINNQNNINEAFKINKDTVMKKEFCPKTKAELIKIIKEKLENDKNADLTGIDTSNITDMSYLFSNLAPEEIDISTWDVSNVTNMEFMFAWCFKLKCEISYWNVENVENMNSMFYFCKEFNSNLSSWDISSVKNMHEMFKGCKNLNQNFSSWEIDKNKCNTYEMFLYTKVKREKLPEALR